MLLRQEALQGHDVPSRLPLHLHLLHGLHHHLVLFQRYHCQAGVHHVGRYNSDIFGLWVPDDEVLEDRTRLPGKRRRVCHWSNVLPHLPELVRREV